MKGHGTVFLIGIEAIGRKGRAAYKMSAQMTRCFGCSI